MKVTMELEEMEETFGDVYAATVAKGGTVDRDCNLAGLRAVLDRHIGPMIREAYGQGAADCVTNPAVRADQQIVPATSPNSASARISPPPRKGMKMGSEWTLYDDREKNNRIEIAKMGRTVARMYYKDDEAMLDAQLIAAAPDLLAAAQRVYDGLVARIDDAPSEAKPVFDGIAELHDAINKATPTKDAGR